MNEKEVNGLLDEVDKCFGESKKSACSMKIQDGSLRKKIAECMASVWKMVHEYKETVFAIINCGKAVDDAPGCRSKPVIPAVESPDKKRTCFAISTVFTVSSGVLFAFAMLILLFPEVFSTARLCWTMLAGGVVAGILGYKCIKKINIVPK